MSIQEGENQEVSATFTPSYDSRTDIWNGDRCSLDIAVLSLGRDARYADIRSLVLTRLQQNQHDASPLQEKALALIQEIGAQIDENWAGFAKRMREKIMQTVPDHECALVCQIIEQATQAPGIHAKGG
jgi:hypothetical protein